MKGFVAAFVIATGLAAPAAAQLDAGPLGAAKDLYASARYDEALTMLNGLRSGDHADRKSVEQYRSLCLLALGRSTEAESAIAAVVTADPTYQPGESDAAPRVRATFTDVRRRLLPDIATSRYVSAKAAYDRREWDAAEQQFRVVLSLIDDPDTGGRLRDLRMLTVGFLELSAKAAAPPPPPPAPAPAPEPKAMAPAAPAAPEPGKIYGSDDAGVLPPVAIKQDIPLVPAAIVGLAKPRGLMEINIDELGRVVSMTIRMSIHPAYDSQLLAAARDWKYQPAMVGGRPVKFRKLIQIAVKR
jgi:tetratricopeptide (TPR) repeat protein